MAVGLLFMLLAPVLAARLTPLERTERAGNGDSMKFRMWALAAFAILAAAAPPASAAPSVYPTGVTIYDPARTWNGYTVLSPLATQAVLVIDMNGNVVKRWDDFNNSAGGPARVLPGGGVIAASGARPPYQESLELVQRDFDGKVSLELQSQRADRAARPRHGLVVAAASRLAARGFSGRLLLAREHAGHDGQQHADPDAHEPRVPAVADVMLEDDRLIEVTPDGRIVVGVDRRASTSTSSASRPTRAPRSRPRPTSTRRAARSTGCTSTRRPTSGRTAGSTPATERFAPNNVIISSRQASLLAIVGARRLDRRGGSGPTSARLRSCARFARSSASTTRT